MAISHRTLPTTAGSAAALAGLPRASAAAAPALGVEGYIQAWQASSVRIVRLDLPAMSRVGISGVALIDGCARLEEPP